MNRRHSAAFVIAPGATVEGAADRRGAKGRADAAFALVSTCDHPPFRRSANVTRALASISTRSETWFALETSVETACLETSASALERTLAARSPAQPSIPARMAMATSNRAQGYARDTRKSFTYCAEIVQELRSFSTLAAVLSL